MRRVLMMLLVVTPATLLTPVALLGLVLGLAAAAGGELPGLLLAAWGATGAYGTVALWAAVLGPRRRWKSTGLIAGVLAALPLALLTVWDVRSAAHIGTVELLQVGVTWLLPLGGLLELLRVPPTANAKCSVEHL